MTDIPVSERLREVVNTAVTAAMIFGSLNETGEAADRERGAVGTTRDALLQAIATLEAAQPQWQSMRTAPMDGTLFLAWAPGREGAPPMYSLCAWHHDGGFCIDEIREATAWMPLPSPPATNSHDSDSRS